MFSSLLGGMSASPSASAPPLACVFSLVPALSQTNKIFTEKKFPRDMQSKVDDLLMFWKNMYQALTLSQDLLWTEWIAIGKPHGSPHRVSILACHFVSC